MDEEDIANVGAQDNHVSLLEEVRLGNQVSVFPAPTEDRDITAYFIQISQSITAQAQVVPTQALAMTTQVNREVVPRGNQYVVTMDSRLRDLTRMNPPTSYG